MKKSVTNTHRGHFGNLGILRLLLATLVVYSHSYPLTNQPEPIGNFTQTHSGGSIAVQAFFLISGYLVTQSLRTSNSLPNYLVARFLRIWPALVCALGFTIALAWVSSNAPIGEFLHGSYAYLKHNLILVTGVSHELPGAFANNPRPSVNGSLWTLPWEVRCYLLLAFLWCLGLLASRRQFLLSMLAMSVLVYASSDLSAFIQAENPDVPWLIGLFALGACAYVIGNLVPAWLFALALFASAWVLFPIDAKTTIALLIASATLILGFSSLIRLPEIKTDISYGVYIYAFPIQQLLIHMLPGITPLPLFFSTMLFLVPVAAASWFLVEKPASALKKPILSILKKCIPDRHDQTPAGSNPGGILTTASWMLLLLIGSAFLLTPKTASNPEQEELPVTWGVFYPIESKLYLRHHWSSGFADKELILPPGSVPLLGRWNGEHLALGHFNARHCEFLLQDDLVISDNPRRVRIDCTPATAQALAGDWNGDGTTDIGLFSPEDSKFQLWILDGDRPNLFHQFQFGQGMTQSTALTGDWDGDGIDTVGLWHAASQQFLLTNQHGTNAGTFSVAASVTSPDAMPFSLKGPGKISRLGLHLWRDGLLTLPDTEETVSYGIPGLLGLPVFQ